MSDSPVREHWYKDSAVIAAIITGVLGLAGTWMSMRNNQESTTNQIVEAERNSDSLSKSKVDFRLNFAQFQRRATDATLSEVQRAVLAQEVVEQNVVWKGYVDEIVPMTNPSYDAAYTVTLVETIEKTDQSMLKTPAIFRLGIEASKEVEGLVAGQKVTLSGVVTQHSLIGTVVENGKILR
jgi:hypothetical protein